MEHVVVCRSPSSIDHESLWYVTRCFRRCPLCPRGANHSLQFSIRRMNEHRRHYHVGYSNLMYEEFINLESVQAVQNGMKKSYVEQKKAIGQLDNDFRSESLLEARVGLLKTCIYYEQEEESCMVDPSLFVVADQKSPLWDELFNGVIKLFAKTEVLCRQPGSTMVRHQMMRNEENVVSSKVFHPVTTRSAKRYAYHVNLK